MAQRVIRVQHDPVHAVIRAGQQVPVPSGEVIGHAPTVKVTRTSRQDISRTAPKGATPPGRSPGRSVETLAPSAAPAGVASASASITWTVNTPLTRRVAATPGRTGPGTPDPRPVRPRMAFTATGGPPRETFWVVLSSCTRTGSTRATTSVPSGEVHPVSMPTPRQPHIKTAVGPYSRLVSRVRTRYQCRCGHPYAAHQHYRGGSECSLCSDCARYRAGRPGIARMVASLTNVLKSRTGPPTSPLRQGRAPSAPMPHPAEPGCRVNQIGVQRRAADRSGRDAALTF